MKLIRNTISKAEIAQLPKVLFEGRIFVVYTEADTEKAVEYLKTQQIVGVDTETRPSFKRGMTHKVALLQIATTDTCFLFRLNRIGMPESLQNFLMQLDRAAGLCRPIRHRGPQPSEDLRQPLRTEDFEEPAPHQLGGRDPHRSADEVCRHRCLGVCGDLQLPGRDGAYRRL